MELLNYIVKLSNDPLFPSLVLFFSVLIWLKLAKTKTLNLPPSPPKLPFIGNIHQLGKLPHRSLRDLSNNYGPLLLLKWGHHPTLLVSSPDMVSEIVKNNDIGFSNKPKTAAMDILLYGCRDFVFAPYGEYWRRVKKICIGELFSHRRVHSFQFVRDEEVEVVRDKIRRACLKRESVNLSEMLMLVSSNIVSRCVLSHSKFGYSARKQLSQFTGFGIVDMFPYLRWLDGVTGYIQSLKALFREFDAFLDQVIQEHRALESDEQVCSKKDFVSIIMQLQKDGMFEMDTQDNIKAILLNMLVGGIDTTARTAEWMMAELLKHPNAMKKVQQEVRSVVGNKPKMDMDDISKMKYLKCVIKETLRLHPSIVLPPRKTSTNVKLGGYDIPSDTTVILNVWAIHRDPKWWEKPEEFIPERFENSPIDFHGKDFYYIPFGFGRRACPGWSFGVASIEYVMTNMLYWFDWKLPTGETADSLDMTEVFGMTITKKTSLHVIPISHTQ